ncbi:MAG: glycosyltransferase family 4 protein [Alphaproteobacteria bacterium]
MSKILYMFDAGDWQSRMEVAHKAQEAGHEIVIGLINGGDKASDFKLISIRKSGQSIGIISSLGMVKMMRDIIAQEKPDIIHVVTLKYSFMAGIAAFGFKGMRKIFTMAGLGYLFRSDDTKSKMLRLILTPFLKFIFRRQNTKLIFQNADDLELFVKGRFVRQENTALIKGSGVYLDHFEKPNESENPLIVLMPTRLVHEKGISIFVQAARLLKEKGIAAKFQIAGGETKHNPKAITRAQMEEMTKNGAVEWLGRVDDLPKRLSSAALIVYPSYYGEGIPRVLLEACAAAKSIITTDHPGCKEAVDHDVNGYLVPVKDAEKTAEAIEELLNAPDMRAQMGAKSREKAEKEFDIHIIAQKTVDMYN